MKTENKLKRMPHREYRGFMSERKVKGYDNLWVVIFDGVFPSFGRWVLCLMDGGEIIGVLDYPGKDAAYNAMEYFRSGKNLNKFRKVTEKL